MSWFHKSFPVAAFRSAGIAAHVPLHPQWLTSRATPQHAAHGAARSRSAAVRDSSYTEEGRRQYDVFVIGGGSAGVRCARVAAERGARVALCELPFDFLSSDTAGGVGGTCVLRGCVPKKLLLFAAEFAPEIAGSRGFGWKLDGSYELQWDEFMEAKRNELLRLSHTYSDTLAKAGVEVFEGRGRVDGPHAVEIDGGRRFTADHIVIATGGKSTKIPIPGAEHCILSDNVLELPRRPKKIVIVGGGYIGVEFAGMFSRLGAEVHVIARGPLPLAPRFDKEVCQFALDQYRAAGIHMHMDCSPVEVTRQEPGDATAPDAARAGADADAATNSGGGAAAAAPRRTLSVRVQRQPPKGEEGKSEGQGEEFVIEGCDEGVLAVGRGGKASGIGLEEAGVKFGPKGGVVVDELSRTSVPSIWAIGDVTGRIALTPVATMEGDALAHTLTGAPTRPDHANVPSAVFSLPFIASVGLTEEQAAEKYPRVAVFSKSYTPLREGIAAAGRAAAAAASRGSGAAGGAAAGPLRGLAKVVVDEESDRLLGVHLVGQDAPEAIQGFAVALKAGATKAQLDSTVGVHPTASEELVQMKGPPTRVVGSAARDGSGTGKGQGAEKGEPARAGGARGGEAASAG